MACVANCQAYGRPFCAPQVGHRAARVPARSRLWPFSAISPLAAVFGWAVWKTGTFSGPCGNSDIRSERFHWGEMTMAPQIRTAVDFYERHPISAQIILTKL